MTRVSLLLFFTLCAIALLPGSAAAAKAPAGLRQIFGIAAATDAIVIPPEWGGIWTYADTSYDCGGTYMFEDAGEDTLCPGAVVVDPGIFPVSYNCTGSADATTVNLTCSGVAEIITDCTATYTYSLNGTRTGDTYFVVYTMSIEYSGTAVGCDLIPDECLQTNTHGTRTGPVPIEYCQTPVLPGSWGQLKVRYR